MVLVQAFNNAANRPMLFGMCAILLLIGVPLLVTAPAKPSFGPLAVRRA